MKAEPADHIDDDTLARIIGATEVLATQGTLVIDDTPKKNIVKEEPTETCCERGLFADVSGPA